MKSIFNPETYGHLLARIEKLSPQTQGQWGKMNVAQMLAHSSQGLRMAMGDIHLKRTLLGRLLGGFFKGIVTGEKPMAKGSPTAPSFVIADERDFSREKEIFLGLLKRMHEGGEAIATTNNHPFFGKLTASEWGQGQYHHIDHHLRQFGV